MGTPGGVSGWWTARGETGKWCHMLFRSKRMSSWERFMSCGNLEVGDFDKKSFRGVEAGEY